MFRSLHDHHQAFLRIKSVYAGYMLGTPTMFTNSTSILYLADRYIKFKG